MRKSTNCSVPFIVRTHRSSVKLFLPGDGMKFYFCVPVVFLQLRSNGSVNEDISVRLKNIRNVSLSIFSGVHARLSFVP